jgi:hypothetical protein
MPRRNFQDGQEVVIQDFNDLSKALERGIYDRVIYEMLQRSSNAFFQDSFRVVFASANSVLVTRGLGFQTDATQSSPEPQYRPLFLPTDTTQLISTPDSVYDRIDAVCVRATLADELTGARKVKDAASNIISTETLVVQKDWRAEIVIVDGSPDPVPTAPATPAGYVKIAELLISAVTGIAGTASVVDTRPLMPVGGSIAIDTTAAKRVTAGPGQSINSLISEIDAFLFRGFFNYLDVEEINTPAIEPAAPAAGRRRLYYRDGVLYLRESNGARTPVGSGAGGGGGGANWQPALGDAPLADYEFDEKVWKFAKDEDQKLTLWVKVPAGFIPGRQIRARLGYYSPGSSDVVRMQTTATLIRRGVDPINSLSNQYVSTNPDLPLSIANAYQEVNHDLSSTLGAVNGFSVQPGDILKVELQRVAPSGTDDNEEVRFIPSVTELVFG